MTPPRFFVLTAGDTPTSAIDYVESKGHVVIASRLTSAYAIPVYGIYEVEGPKAEEGTP